MIESSGLTCGITAYHLRLLCENPWEGGAGYAPSQVQCLTLDQIMFRLCDRKLLKDPIKKRKQSMEPLRLTERLKPDSEGLFSGRAVDGTVIRARIGGKSKARMLMEAEEKKQKKRNKRRR